LPPTDATGFDHPDLLERLSTLLATAPPGEAPGGGLAPPMAALNAAPRRFREVYGEAGLLGSLAADATRRGDPALADLLGALDRGLRDGTLALAPPPGPAPRLAAYVYPVI
jgi:hypothetical protein